MSNVSNAKNVSGKIFVELKDAKVDSVTLDGVIINGYTFTLTKRTEYIGFEKFEHGMTVELTAYLSQKNILFLNTVSFKTEAEQVTEPNTLGTPRGEIKNLSNVTITSVSLKSVSLDENEYFFSKHTEKTFEPAVGMVVDAVVYETASGRLYLNGIAPVKGAEKNGSGSSESGKEQKDYSNNHRLFGYIEMVTEKAIKVGNQWFNLTEKSYVDEKTVMDKGEYVAIYFYASPKSGNFINKLYPATDKYSKKSA
ncbi:MAG: DUF5666 domain-containing protein [Deferribacterales bacterium]